MANFGREIISTEAEGNSTLHMESYSTDGHLFLLAHETSETPNSTTLIFTKEDALSIREALDDYLQWVDAKSNR